tara:strand:+ start:465 stop:740 length:276 start_codon:yes stop_codon:yes gene_type:complete
MTIFVRDSKQPDGPIKTSVKAVGKEFSEFLKTYGKIVKTAENRTLISLPWVFEQIDNSDVYIIRSIKDNSIPDKFMQELTQSLSLVPKIEE